MRLNPIIGIRADRSRLQNRELWYCSKKTPETMAEATCFQIDLHKMEERMSALQVTIDQKLSDVREELIKIHELVANISHQLVDFMRQNMEMMCQNADPQREGYHATTRFTMVDIPRLPVKMSWDG